MKNNIAVLLINTGSPDGPEKRNVAKYLSRFLGHRRIISNPFLFRKLLVNMIIIPFRIRKSSARYLFLWKEYNQTFPLVHYGFESQKLLQEKLKDEAQVFLGMCFGKPDIKKIIQEIARRRFSQLIIIPLFPHYASSSTGVALEMVMKELKQYPLIPQVKTINSFYEHPLFIDAFAEKISSYHPENYEQIMFTYHSLPMSHVKKAENTPYCYVSACMETTRLISEKLNMPKEKIITTFQSQISKDWLQPFSDQIIIEKAKQGIKSLLIVAPSFVADCLETSIELGIEYKRLFLNNGGEKCELVKSLNDSEKWIELLKNIYILSKK